MRRKALIVAANERMGDVFWSSCKAGLLRLGFSVEVVAPADTWPLTSERPDIVVAWNGYKRVHKTIRERCLAAGIPHIIGERGWFDRRVYSQLDHVGFNYRASWAKSLTCPAPDAGAERFKTSFGRAPAAFRKRDGYVLVLLQVPGDAQLQKASVKTPDEILDAVEEAVPVGVKIVARSHPEYEYEGVRSRVDMSRGKTLAEDVAGARFAITINSNSGNEALAMGCPVLYMGPSLAVYGKVALQADQGALPSLVENYLDGWQPKGKAVTNFLHHLACRQYDAADLADGSVLAKVATEAGCKC